MVGGEEGSGVDVMDGWVWRVVLMDFCGVGRSR